MAYGFSFRFLSDWQIQEVTDPEDTMARHRVTSSDPDEPLATLHIAFKTADEDQQIAPTGIGAGEITDRGSLPFLGESSPPGSRGGGQGLRCALWRRIRGHAR